MAKRRKPQPKTKQGGLGKLMSDLRTQLPDNVKFIQRPAGESKISAVFLEFIEPFKQYATTDAAMEKLIVLGICAWNAEVVPPAERQKLIDTVIQTVLGQVGKEWNHEVTHIVDSLTKRKRKRFADDRRYIVSYRFESTADDYHLSMVSTLLDVTKEAK